MKISFYNRVTDKSPSTTMNLMDFMLDVQQGQWKDQTEQVQKLLAAQAKELENITDSAITEAKAVEHRQKKQDLKKSICASVTLSGTFKRHQASDLQEHSGYLAIDIDDVDVTEYTDKLKDDVHCTGLFKSISGKGLCFVMAIDKTKHLDAFLGAEKYFFEKYGISIDKSCKDVSRLRYVSYDKDCYINKAAKTFVSYIRKTKVAPKKKAQTSASVHVSSAFDHAMNEIGMRGVDILNDEYQRWVDVAFAFADEFGEGGRTHFHDVSRHGAKYNSPAADKQFSECLKHTSGGGAVTMGTFYYYCSEANIEAYTPELKQTISYAQQLKRKTTSRGEAIKKIAEKVSEADAEQIVQQVYDANKADFQKISKDKVLSELLQYILTEFDIRKDVITGRVEVNRVPITDDVLNGMYIECKMVVHPTVSLLDVTSIVYSTYVPKFEPILNFVAKHKATPIVGDPIIDLIDCIKPVNEAAKDFNRIFFKKWMVGMIANIHNNVSPLVVVLVGIKQHTGKTEFMRRLLPKGLMKYYNESKLDAGKDDERLMCQSILIMDDEFGGKSKLEEKRFKEVTSKRTFTIRLPYGRNMEQLKRMATLGGTTNDHQIINDTTGNRRLVPIQVDEFVDIKKYNAIDKDAAFMHAWNLYHEGFNYDLTESEIALLNGLDAYSAVDTEEELILKHFSSAEGDGYIHQENRTGTDILEYIIQESSIKQVSKRKIGIIMKKHGFETTRKNSPSGSRLTLYNVWRKDKEDVNYKDLLNKHGIAPAPEVSEDDLPF